VLGRIPDPVERAAAVTLSTRNHPMIVCLEYKETAAACVWLNNSSRFRAGWDITARLQYIELLIAFVAREWSRKLRKRGKIPMVWENSKKEFQPVFADLTQELLLRMHERKQRANEARQRYLYARLPSHVTGSRSWSSRPEFRTSIAVCHRPYCSSLLLSSLRTIKHL
jgi:hypothetical protein